MLNVEQYKDLMDEIGAATLPDGLKDETDWFKETYKTGISQNYQLSVSNGNEKIRYYIGGGYTDEEGIIDVAYNKRYNFKASVDSDLYDWISVGTNIAYSSYRSNGIISGTGSNLTTPAENMARTENNYSQTNVGVDYLIPVLKEIYAINWLGEMIQSVSEVPARPRGLATLKRRRPDSGRLLALYSGLPAQNTHLSPAQGRQRKPRVVPKSQDSSTSPPTLRFLQPKCLPTLYQSWGSEMKMQCEVWGRISP